MKNMSTKDHVIKNDSKIKLSEDDFILIGMNYNYYMIPRLAHTKDNLEGVKQQILENQKMVEELRTIWTEGEHDMIIGVVGIMDKYFGKKQNNKPKIINIGSNTGIVLLNTCTKCSEKFKPKNSMTYETLCDSCQEKIKSN